MPLAPSTETVITRPSALAAYQQRSEQRPPLQQVMAGQLADFILAEQKPA